MIVIEQHLRSLLLNNDCVTIPRFGGLIAYYVPAAYLPEEKYFIPPYRTFGFNPQLTVNDGLLVQSYMSKYGINYADATQRLEKDLMLFKEELYKNGSLTLASIGTFSLKSDNGIDFLPAEGGYTTPDLYGLDGFEIAPVKVQKKVGDTLYIPINRYRLKQVASIAAAVILLFLFVTPISNDTSQAEVRATFGYFASSEQLLHMESIASSYNNSNSEANSEEVTIAPVYSVNRPVQLRSKVEVSATTVAVDNAKSETEAAPEPKPETIQKEEASVKVEATPEKENVLDTQQTQYYIIVASLVSREGAEQTIEELARKGHKGGTIIERDRRFRVCFYNSTDLDEANKALENIHQIELFKEAWLLTVNGK